MHSLVEVHQKPAPAANFVRFDMFQICLQNVPLLLLMEGNKKCVEIVPFYLVIPT
jgi:hypothetical protein